MTDSDKTCAEKKNNERYLEFAVPIVSFGATFAGVVVWQAGVRIGFQYFSIGCMAASCILAYLAWIRPRKDIVSLSTPLYAFIFFVVPTDFMAGLVLQLLYAASLSILLLRLKRRFGATQSAVASGKELAAPLLDYVQRTCEIFSGTPRETGHAAAVIISQFALGDYGVVARVASTATGQPEVTGPLLDRAFEIVHEQAAVLERTLPRPEKFRTFEPGYEAQLAKHMFPSDSDDRKFDTTLENALLILFSTGWNASEADRPYLLACQDFIMRLLAE
jgi:hypothetical protein